MTITLATSFFISFIVSVLSALILIPFLRRMKAGQSIKRDGPVWHMHKEGTPTMGGLIFIAGMTVSVVITGYGSMREGEYTHLAMLAFSCVFGVIGFLDDYEKVKKRGNTGLTIIQKFLLQLSAAAAFIFLLRYLGHLSTDIYIPFINVTIHVWEPLYFTFAALVIVGMLNAVNFTDGVDGLLTGVTIPVAGCFVVAAYSWAMAVQGIFSAAMLGALAAFLIFNFNPAKVFMGDTGSHFLGGAVCALAFAFDMPLVLAPLGFVYIVEMISDLIQIFYFKATHGKRFFKMAPLHHHFEKCGWHEKKVFAVFSGVSLLFAVIAWAGIRNRYGL